MTWEFFRKENTQKRRGKGKSLASELRKQKSVCGKERPQLCERSLSSPFHCAYQLPTLLYFFPKDESVFHFYRSCCCSVAKSCPPLCHATDCSTPGSSVLHYLPEFAQIHVHWVSEAIKLSLQPPFPFAFNLSQHQGLLLTSCLFALGSQSTGASASASVFPMNI